jgi:transcriptional regulator with XRE-family HTH domain
MIGEGWEPAEGAAKLAIVIGKNVSQLRKDARLTLDQVSIAARNRGLSWSESRVADFERGKVAPNLATLVAVCLALADAGCADVTLPALLCSEVPIQVNGLLWLTTEQFTNLLTGRPTRGDSLRDRAAPELATAAIQSFFDAGFPKPLLLTNEVSGATEERTSKALGIDKTALADWSAKLWKRPFSEERDRRAGDGANAQKRGQVTREMRTELEAAMRAARHGDDK